MAKAYDLVLWGATGFTGRLVAKYLAETVKRRLPTLRWAVAARDAGRLRQLQDELVSVGLAAPPLLVASATSQDQVDQVVSQAKVLISTAGPFARLGTPVVEACVRLGCDYVDINGEVGWHRTMIDRYDAAAREKGVVLVPSAGFDSIPSDLGAHWMASRIRERFGAPARRVTCYVSLRGNFSGGTVASGILAEETHGARLDPFFLGGERAGGPRDEDADVTAPAFDPVASSWTAPFGMASINTRIVRRSVALLDEAGGGSPYGAAFSYRECALSPDERAASKAARAASAPANKRRELVESGRLPKPGEGPPPEERARSWFKFLLLAEGEGGGRLLGSVSGGDPGYDETAKMVAETALALATDRAALPAGRRGGFMTPASACGAPLRVRLHAEGIAFDELALDMLPGLAAPTAKL